MANLIPLIILGVGLFWVVSLIAGKQNAARLFSGVGGALFKGILGLMSKLLSATFVGASRLSVAGFNGLRNGGMHLPMGSGGPAVLAPGDSAPAPDRHADFMDYRGVALEREIRSLRQTSGQSGVRLGRYVHPRGRQGAPLMLPASLLQRNCAVIGPPGSGKTEGIILPWTMELLQAGHSVVTVDIKGDLYDRLAPMAQAQNFRVWYWNPSDAARSLSWNWLDGVRDNRDVEAAVQSLLGRPRPNDSQPFFYERDTRWLRTLISLIKLAYGSQAKPRDLYRLVGNRQALLDLFRQYPAAQAQAHDVMDLMQFAAQDYSRAVSGLLSALHLFNAPHVVAVSEHSDFMLAGVGTQPTLLIVGAGLADARAGETWSSLLLNQLVTFIYRRFSPGGSQTPLPLYFIVDEAARLKERINFEEVLAVARSAKVGVCLAAQDVTQFGDERQQTAILANCLSFIALSGCSPHTAQFFAQRLGQRNAQAHNIGRNRGPFDVLSNYDRSIATSQMAVLGEREIMHRPHTLGPYSAVVHVQPVSPKPFLVDLTC